MVLNQNVVGLRGRRQLLERQLFELRFPVPIKLAETRPSGRRRFDRIELDKVVPVCLVAGNQNVKVVGIGRLFHLKRGATQSQREDEGNWDHPVGLTLPTPPSTVERLRWTCVRIGNGRPREVRLSKVLCLL